MKLKELICQGLGTGAGIVKFEFGEGYNLLQTGEKGISPCEFDMAVTSLIFPDQSPWEINSSFGDPAQAGIRLGVTFIQNGHTYRFVKDVAKKACVLSRYNPQKSDFEEISKDVKFIKKAFKETFKIPSENVFKSLFKIDPGYLSSKLSDDEGALGNNESDAYFQTLERDASIEEKYEMLKGLLAESKTLERMRAIEFDMDGMQAKLFEITDKIGKVRSAEEEVKRIALELEEYKAVESMDEFPKDIEKKLAEFEKSGEKKDSMLLELDNRLDNLVEKMARLDPNPVQKDPIFIAGAACALVSFVLTVAMADLRFFFFPLLVLAMGTVAWRLINFFAKRDEEEKLKKEIRALKEEKTVIQKKFDIETSVVRKFISKTGESHASDALDTIKKSRELRQKFQSVHGALEGLKKEVKFEEIAKEKTGIEEKIKKTEQELRNLPSVSMDPNDLKNTIERLRLEIGEENIERLSKGDGDDNVPHNVYERLVSWSSKLLKFPEPKIIDALKNSFAVNLKALSGGVLKDAVWGKLGPEKFVFDDSRTCGLGELGGQESFMAFFAFQFTLLALLAKYCPIPLMVLGTSEIAYPDYDKRLFLKALNHLSKSFQIVHVT